jgi:hypothetical protein
MRFDAITANNRQIWANRGFFGCKIKPSAVITSSNIYLFIALRFVSFRFYSVAGTGGARFFFGFLLPLRGFLGFAEGGNLTRWTNA